MPETRRFTSERCGAPLVGVVAVEQASGDPEVLAQTEFVTEVTPDGRGESILVAKVRVAEPPPGRLAIDAVQMPPAELEAQLQAGELSAGTKAVFWGTVSETVTFVASRSPVLATSTFQATTEPGEPVPERTDLEI